MAFDHYSVDMVNLNFDLKVHGHILFLVVAYVFVHFLKAKSHFTDTL